MASAVSAFSPPPDAAASGGAVRILGGRPLHGEIRLRGAKNSVPKAMVAALLTEEPCRLTDVPEIVDVDLVSAMLSGLGCALDRREDGVVDVEARRLQPMGFDDLRDFAGKSRIPILLCGPLLARLGEAFAPMPGGCRIGPRPIGFHIDALRKLGAEIEERPDGLRLRAKRLRGARISLDYPSVGATEQILLAAVMAEGATEIAGAAMEPEIVELAAILQKMGALISIDVGRVIRIEGVDRLHGFSHNACPDRLEAASWACAAAACGGEIVVRGARQTDMMTFLNVYRKMGGEFDIHDDRIVFRRRRRVLSSQSLETDVHPGFMTDWQQPLVVALTQAEGISIIHETVYEDRFGYVGTLQRMGAGIQLYRECLGGSRCRFGRRNIVHSAAVMGPTPLHGVDMSIPDLRGGFSYIVAALVAEGWSAIDGMAIIRRGYERFFDKLVSLGVKIETPDRNASRPHPVRVV